MVFFVISQLFDAVEFYLNILYEIVCKNVHTFMKKNIWTPRVFLIFFTFFERILYKSNCIFISS